MTVTWINGALTSNPGVPPNDRGFLFGDGLLETMLVHDGTPFRLSQHLERLAGGCERMGIPPVEGLPAAVAEVLEANPRIPLAALRIIVTRGEGGPLMPRKAATPTVLVTLAHYHPDSAWYEKGLSARIVETRLDQEGSLVGLKHLGYLKAILALRASARVGADEALFLNRAGQVAEASASNIFCVVKGTLHTPPLSAGILAGITRAVVLEVAQSGGIPCRVVDITPEELMGADEVFLTSSLRGLVPLREIEGAPIGDGVPGPVFKSLRESYESIRTGEADGA